MTLYRTSLTFVCLLPLCLCGCNEGAPAALKGQITFDGKPIGDGTLRLFQMKDTPGFGAQAAIRDGRYSIDLEQGLFAGSYRIEVRATRSTGRTDLPDEGIPGMPKPEKLYYEYIPARYNDRSILELRLEPGENQRNLELERDPEWEREQAKDSPEWARNAILKGQ